MGIFAAVEVTGIPPDLWDRILGPQGLLVVTLLALLWFVRDHLRRDRATEDRLEKQTEINDRFADAFSDTVNVIKDNRREADVPVQRNRRKVASE